MDKRKLIKAALVVCAGGMMFGGGCLGFGLGNGLMGRLAFDAVEYAAFEFVADNDAVFDLFQDDFGTGTQYDDRFVVDATRAEPDDASQAITDLLAGR